MHRCPSEVYKVLMETLKWICRIHINALKNVLADLKRVLANVCQNKLGKVIYFHLNKDQNKIFKGYANISAYNRKYPPNLLLIKLRIYDCFIFI